MNEYLNHLLFGIYPYIALVTLALGSIVRFDREPYSWRAGSSQLLRRKQLMWGSVLFHVGVLVVFFGVETRQRRLEDITAERLGISY